MFLNLLLFSLFWNGLYLFCAPFINHIKINKNNISFIHCLICSLLAYNNCTTPNYIYLYYFSSSYFIWDMAYILYNKQLSNSLYIYHHLVSLWALYALIQGNNSKLINYVFLLSETSNIFNFLVYHLIKIKSRKSIINVFSIIQLLWFFYFRLIHISSLVYDNFFLVEDRLFAYTLGTIHILSGVWVYKQFTTLKANLLN